MALPPTTALLCNRKRALFSKSLRDANNESLVVQETDREIRHSLDRNNSRPDCADRMAAIDPPASTGITIKPKDGSIIFARTLEFAADLHSNIIIVPRGKNYTGTAPGNGPGLRWTTKYGTIGTNAFDLPVVVDGINEKGLSVGLFYFPGFAQYQEVNADEAGRALAPWEIGSYLLGTCADMQEAVAAMQSVRVGEVVQKDMGFVPPVHVIVSDAGGNSSVLEYVGGELKIHSNPFGVMTNSPTFDWHMTNLSNYVNLSADNKEKIDLAGKAIKGLGQGSGMLGLPGDFTPPSRFVRGCLFQDRLARRNGPRGGLAGLSHSQSVRHPQGSSPQPRTRGESGRLHSVDEPAI